MNFDLLGTHFQSMKFVLIVHQFGDGFCFHFRCVFDICSIRVRNLLKLQNHCVYNDFTLQRNMIFDNFHDLFRHLCWHWLLMSLGIDFSSILGAFWFQFSFLWLIFSFKKNVYRCCSKLVSTSRRRHRPFSVLFRDLFPHFSTCYFGKTYKCQKLRFPTLF